jgi:hypothetical protein
MASQQEQMTKDIPIHLLTNEFYMKEVTETTRDFLQQGMNINTITRVVKDYTQQFLLVQEHQPEPLSAFTFEMWRRLWNIRNDEEEDVEVDEPEEEEEE